MKIKGFCSSKNPVCRAWLYDGPVKFYLRKTDRYFHQGRLKTIDIACITVDEDERRQGHVTRIIKIIEGHTFSNDRIVYVENAHSEILRSILVKRGYECCDAANQCYVLTQPNEDQP